MNLNLKTTKVFKQIKEAFDNIKYNVIAIHGGTRSSKTYSTTQFLIVQCLLNSNKVITITGKSMNWLKRGPERDLILILKDLDYYSIKRHNLSNHTYSFPNGSMIEFLSTEDEEKLKGPGRFIVFCNEGNSLSQGAFLQLSARTENKILIDYNPSFRKDHWLYKVLEDPKTKSLHSTYLDNPFLSKIQKDNITNMINLDLNYHRIYVLGLPALDIDNVYNHFKEYTEIPEDEIIDFVCYGVDWGFNDPMVVVEVTKTKSNKYYVKQLLYQSGKSSLEVVDYFKDMKVNNLLKGVVYCDHKPEVRLDLNRAGVVAKNAIKDILKGIDTVRASEIYVHKDSDMIWDEYEKYIWKTINGVLTNMPIDKFNHTLDSIRYAVHSTKTSVKDLRYYSVN